MNFSRINHKFVPVFLSVVLISMLIPLSPAMAQTVPTVGFTISPSVFATGQASSALLCLSPLPTAEALAFDQNDVIGFQFDDNIGTVTAVDSAVLVHSSTLLQADFQTRLNVTGNNKVTITYTNSTSKQFAYTDTVCAKVTFTAGATVGSSLVRYSSKFTGIAGVVGNLPYLTVAVVDFPAGAPGPQGPQGVKGDTGPQGLPGTSPDLTSVLARLDALEAATPVGRVYVANQNDNTVSVINTVTNSVVAVVPVVSPTQMAIDGAGGRVYVTSLTSTSLSVITTATNTVVATVADPPLQTGVAANQTGTRAYATIPAAFNSVPGTVSVINAATNTVVATVTVGVNPRSAAVNAAGTRVYVANGAGGTVSVIDTATNTVASTIQVGVGVFLFAVAVNPAGTRVYTVDAQNRAIIVIDATNNSVQSTVTVGDTPVAVAVNPAGTRVYVANNRGHTVSVIDASTNIVVATVPVGAAPMGIAVNSAGTRVYVTNSFDSTVSVIDTITNTVVATIAVGQGPQGIAAN